MIENKFIEVNYDMVISSIIIANVIVADIHLICKKREY